MISNLANKETCKTTNVKETKVLNKISLQDKDQLLLHPLIRFFTWLKWSAIRHYMIRKLMFQLLFCFCISWYLLTKYDNTPEDNSCFFDFLTPAMSTWCNINSTECSSKNLTKPQLNSNFDY